MSKQNLLSYIKQSLAAVRYKKYEDKKAKLEQNGTIKHFDKEFFEQFDGMYFDGLPIYYYLNSMNMGKCYDTSAILALAMGEGANVCRGVLSNLPSIYSKHFHHGWVEKDGKVYDTTWQIILPIEDYYKMFGVKHQSVTDMKTFFENNKEMAKWEIHTKEDYEKEFCPLETLLIFLVSQTEQKNLQNQNLTTTEREYSQKLLKDLPNVTLENFSQKIEEMTAQKQ